MRRGSFISFARAQFVGFVICRIKAVLSEKSINFIISQYYYKIFTKKHFSFYIFGLYYICKRKEKFVYLKKGTDYARIARAYRAIPRHTRSS